jgi:hypothetical protein
MAERPYISQYQPTVFLGGLWLDDCQALEYQATDPKEPLFGFRDREWRHVAQGQTVVHGMIDVNFRFKGYLSLAIANLSNLDRLLRSEFFLQSGFGGQTGVLTVREVLHALTEANEFGDGSITTNTLTAEARESLLTQSFERFDFNQFTRLSDALRDDIWDGLGAKSADPTSKEHIQRTRARPGTWPYGFNMSVVYDQTDPFDSEATQDNAMVEILRDVRITSQSKIIVNNAPGGGRPIVERYQFIASSVD